MQPNAHHKRVMKILIFAFLCAEMQTTFTHRELTKQRGIGSSSGVGQKRISPAPYQASIRLAAEEDEYFGKGHICSGALVGPSVVLTLGQCLYNNDSHTFYHPAELRVVLGSTQRFAPTAHSQIFGVTHVYRPPKELTLAILMLEQDVPVDQPRIQPISMAMTPLGQEQQPETGLISSWGLAVEDSQELHEMLTLGVTELHYQEPKQIRVAYDEQVQQLGYRLDEGAPLAKANQLVGLHSESTIFVDVASHVDWIKAKTGNGTNQNSAIWGILGLLVFSVYVVVASRKDLLY